MTLFREGEKRCNWKLAVVELIVGMDKEVRGGKVRLVDKEKRLFLDRIIEKNFSLRKLKLDRVVEGKTGKSLQSSQRDTCMNNHDKRQPKFQKQKQRLDS